MTALDGLIMAAAISARRALGDLAKLKAAALRYAADRVRATGERITTELGPKRMADFLEDLVEEEDGVPAVGRSPSGGDLDEIVALRSMKASLLILRNEVANSEWQYVDIEKDVAVAKLDAVLAVAGAYGK